MASGTMIWSSRSPNNPSPGLSPFGGAFVGLQQELADLKAALEESLTGRGRLASLVGKPGFGKTRTAQELASHAETLGAQVLWGRCYESSFMAGRELVIDGGLTDTGLESAFPKEK